MYYQWEFRTGAREDFESIVARLAPRDFSGAVGRRPMDISAPGFAGDAASHRVPDRACSKARCSRSTRRAAPFPDAATTAVAARCSRSSTQANALAPRQPMPSSCSARRSTAAGSRSGTPSARAPAPTWLDELNLDPRERVVAALGTRVIQEQQEELMAEAWEQAGEMAQANQRLRQMQLSLAITSRLHARHVKRIDDDDALWRFAAPAQSRLVMPGRSGGRRATTMRAMLASSSTPQVVTSAAMRRLSRPRGAVSRRAATAVRIAGMQPAPATETTGASSMFRLYGQQPWVMIFTCRRRAAW